MTTDTRAVPRSATWTALWSVAPLIAGALAMYVPTGIDLFRGYWLSDDNAHGPLVLAISVWLLHRKWAELQPAVRPAGDGPSPGAWALIAVALFFYVFGRSQQIIQAESVSLIPLLMGLTVLLYGGKVLKQAWFPFFFMLFMVPLPGTVVDPVTLPMKTAVSYFAEQLMHAAGYPVARVGVILYVAQYQMLVADACAGLRTLFTLEALGLLYLNLIRYQSVGRNIGLALLIVPISMSANVIRVVVLCLVTYYLGDEAGQGFLHGFAGFVLFFSALALTLGADSLLRLIFGKRDEPRAQGA
jgi:exosortase B